MEERPSRGVIPNGTLIYYYVTLRERLLLPGRKPSTPACLPFATEKSRFDPIAEGLTLVPFQPNRHAATHADAYMMPLPMRMPRP